ncbi:DEAD/DEAH box helicase family protein [Clostridium sp. Sa3CUN1]|uniref:DEAD/DEAH box helicase family protein n=1 Tax=Clostridium gallinarum TaxID=2762246 RepID=A0ABR8Q313_9CLOT|nr:DEAD/DEAH box helicase family protein [Clostridium gallinarum]MBD7914801.1 DEAD/DEAH box helicase family protein [Clostridium gallinarum]
MKDIVKLNYAGTKKVNEGKNPRVLYEHQIEAISKLNEINKRASFSSLLVLPTGGGKTATAVYWLLKEAVNNKKKILWVAHRHLLLEQAAETFKNNAYSNLLYNISEFSYRIVSGKHDRAIHIKPSDDILIISKDSAIKNLDYINKWIGKDEEIYLVIDEAHHSIAKSYRKLIDNIYDKVKNVKLLGLTATPFRTADNEEGLLAKIYKDGIVFKIDLKDLIKKEILSRPNFEECETEINFGDNLGLKAIKSIESLDTLPEDVAQKIAENKERNRLIVNKYLEKKNIYGQTIVFAVNRVHAFALRKLFEESGVKAEVIVSGTFLEFTGVDISNEANEENIRKYRDGEIQVLINVNILTEGIDLPQTKTVFLTRPTISTILMTQMIGRALRGEKAGGTKEAHVVSFIDDWKERIAWVNPELTQENNEFADNNYDNEKKLLRLISIKKIEEFAMLMDETVDTSELEKIEFMKRVPLGMYAFTFIDDNSMEKNHQVLVYDSTKDMYEEFINDLPLIFEAHNINEEYIEDDVMNKLLDEVENTYFNENMLPKYDKEDIKNILKYYAEKECKPKFITFEDVDRESLNLKTIALNIIEKDMRRSEINDYIEGLWNDENQIIKIYFNKKLYFKQQLQKQIDILENPEDYPIEDSDFIEETRELEKLSINEIERISPKKAKEIKDKVYYKFTNKDGTYYCKACGYESNYKGLFQIDHIKPMAKGGLTILSNLQLLCKNCNKVKGDKYE